MKKIKMLWYWVVLVVAVALACTGWVLWIMQKDGGGDVECGTNMILKDGQCEVADGSKICGRNLLFRDGKCEVDVNKIFRGEDGSDGVEDHGVEDLCLTNASTRGKIWYLQRNYIDHGYVPKIIKVSYTCKDCMK